jgi:hypothetical protein
MPLHSKAIKPTGTSCKNGSGSMRGKSVPMDGHRVGGSFLARRGERREGGCSRNHGRTGGGGPVGGQRRKGPKPEAFRKYAKLINDLFGPQKGRGHGITENNEAKGVQNRTVSLEAATLYVLNDWVKEQKLVLKEKESWDAMRARWTAEGIPKKERDRMEAKSLLEILQCMPVFVMQNGGVYYFKTMLL